MGNVQLVPFTEGHCAGVAAIYNSYVKSGTAAFPQEPVGAGFFSFLLEMPEFYPVYVLQDTEKGRIAGFCFLSPFHPQPTFRKTALVDYFLLPEYTGRGLGTHCLQRLEQDAKRAGITHLIADISGENPGSIAFHKKHGFRQCGVH